MKKITKKNSHIFYDIFCQYMNAVGAEMKSHMTFSELPYESKEFVLKDVFHGKHLTFSITNDHEFNYFVAANWHKSWDKEDKRLGTHWKNNFYPDSKDPFEALLETTEYYYDRFGIGASWGEIDGGIEYDKVVFRKWPEDGSIIALFPDIIGDSKGNCVSYEHLGQHSAAGYSHVVAGTVPATKDAYEPLFIELNKQGYILKPVKRK